MLKEHCMENAQLVVTLALAPNDDDDDEDEASTEEHRKSVPGSTEARHCFRHESSGGVLGKTFKHQTSLRRNVPCNI